MTVSDDRYKYFRIEARELVQKLGQGALKLEREGSVEMVRQLLRVAHTLKGASRVVEQNAISDLAHQIEDALGPYRDDGAQVPDETASHLLLLVDRISKFVALLEHSSPASEDQGAAAENGEASVPGDLSSLESFDTMRVDVEELDGLLEKITQVRSTLAMVDGAHGMLTDCKQIATVLEERLVSLTRELNFSDTDVAPLREVTEQLRARLVTAQRQQAVGLDSAERETEQLRDKASQLRLMQAGMLFSGLERAARDVAESIGRRVRFETSGASVRVDAHVLASLRDGLLHVVRNAVAHGIEPESERTAQGKPAEGKVRLSVTRIGQRVSFACEDDGAGIDAEAVRQAATRSGLLSKARAHELTRDEALQLVFAGGVSTSELVSNVSGRGVGLEILKIVANELRGDVRVESEPGKGTRIEALVPISLSSLSVLELEEAGVQASLPLDAVARTLRVESKQIAKTSDGRRLTFGGQAIPFVPLGEALHLSHPRQKRDAWVVVIVKAGERLAAVGVDRLQGTFTAVLHSIPRLAGPTPSLHGAFLDSLGNPRLVVDPNGLLAAIESNVGQGEEIEPAALPPVLVIDDSLTTRMLEQSILETAGYDVVLAASAEEGLAKASHRKFGVFVCDVEMPGMSGFEFVEKTRADPALGQIPTILVTSRGDTESRRRGKEAGAYAYIVKGEFDEGRLLDAVRQVIG